MAKQNISEHVTIYPVPHMQDNNRVCFMRMKVFKIIKTMVTHQHHHKTIDLHDDVTMDFTTVMV